MLCGVFTRRPKHPDHADGSTAPPTTRLADLLALQPKNATLPYLHSLLWVAAATAVSYLIYPLNEPANIVMVYLLAVALIAARFGRLPGVTATVFGALSCVYFMPQQTFAASVPTFVVMLFVGLIVSSMTAQLRVEAIMTMRREKRIQALYQLSRGLAAAENREDVANVVREHLRGIFGCTCLLLESTPSGLAASAKLDTGLEATPTLLGHAKLALRERRTFDTGDCLLLPMVVANESVGVLCCQGIGRDHHIATANIRLIEAVANNAAIALLRMMVGDDARVSQQRVDQERLRNVMLSSMSHDFRTPLASITGAVTTLIDSVGRLDELTRMDLMHSIREDAEFLERKIRNMLDLTKLEAGNLRVHRELHPMDEVVGGAMTRAEKQLEGRRVDIDVSPQLPMVAVDALLIEQLLVNLIENAVRYAPSWSPIEVAVHQNGDRIRIQVADRGPGIPRGQHERVFEKFYRIGASSRSSAGLGLAICKAIAQLHDGRIWVEDREGGGALFQVDLPIGENQPEDQPTGNLGSAT
jgi:two-component system sensor histidine kinase KdpD